MDEKASQYSSFYASRKKSELCLPNIQTLTPLHQIKKPGKVKKRNKKYSMFDEPEMDL